MQRFLVCFLTVCLVFSLSACFHAPNDGPDEVGKDWHTWGIYEFARINDLSIAIDPVNNDQGQHIGYDIYRDGQTLGALLGQIRPEDGGFTPADMRREDFLVFRDFDGDGREEIGAPLTNGKTLWYDLVSLNGRTILRFAGIQ